MRIVIANTHAPFVSGGAELHAQSLCQALRRAGHEAELVTMPFSWKTPDTIVDHIIAASSLDASEYFGAETDLMIGLKFPAYLMRHPRKVTWLIHQYREAYDLWDEGVGGLINDPKGLLVRDLIRDIDTRLFSANGPVFANSRNVANRLKKYNGIDSDPLYHPPPLADRMKTGAYGNYFYFPSRISGLKRQDMVLDALAECSTPARFIFSGNADTPAVGARFRARIEELDLTDRVEWRGHVSNEEMIDLYAGARAVVFPPFDEDLGYITLEAMLAGKAVITASDSGGPLEFITDGKQGLVAEPKAKAFAKALDRLWRNPGEAESMGRNAAERYRSLSISWDNVVEKLTGSRDGDG